MSIAYFSEERCVMCGEVIEEGRQVCFRCERMTFQQEDHTDEPKITEAKKRNKRFTRSILKRKR